MNEREKENSDRQRRLSRARRRRIGKGSEEWKDQTPRTFEEQVEHLIAVFEQGFPFAYINKYWGRKCRSAAEDIFQDYQLKMWKLLTNNIDENRGLAMLDDRVLGFWDFRKMTPQNIRWVGSDYWEKRDKEPLLSQEEILLADPDRAAPPQDIVLDTMVGSETRIPEILNQLFISGTNSTAKLHRIAVMLAAGSVAPEEELDSLDDQEVALLEMIDPVRFVRRLDPDSSQYPFRAATDEQYRTWKSRARAKPDTDRSETAGTRAGASDTTGGNQ